jgi:DNA primase
LVLASTFKEGVVMVEQRVDFGELKQWISMADILGQYGLLDKLKPQKGGDELVGLCPFHQEKRRSLHVSVRKNAWQCFGCKRHGNILDFVAHKEGVDIRKAALMIQGWFDIGGEKSVDTVLTVSEKPHGASEVPGPADEQPVQENPPLTFELKNLDPKHTYLKERGVSKEAIEFFGLGYCSRGLMKGRIAIPIHDERGKLVAYAGRWPGDPPEDTEKYLLPPNFRKSLVVFNLHRVGESAKEAGLILVEGFFSVFRLWQAGFSNGVALMGSYLSECQRDLLVATLGPDGRVILLFDNDEAGRECEAQCLDELSQHLYVKVVRLPGECQQLDNLTVGKVRQLLTGD